MLASLPHFQLSFSVDYKINSIILSVVFNIHIMLTAGSEVIRITGPQAIPTGIPVIFTCRRMHTPDSIAWRLYYTSASGSTRSVFSFGNIMDLMSTVANFIAINESTSELVLNTTNRNITSIDCNVRDVSGTTQASSINVTVYGKFCLFHRFICCKNNTSFKYQFA